MTKRLQVLIVVDLDRDVVTDELTVLLPHERERREIIRLTELGATRLERGGDPPPARAAGQRVSGSESGDQDARPAGHHAPGAGGRIAQHRQSDLPFSPVVVKRKSAAIEADSTAMFPSD